MKSNYIFNFIVIFSVIIGLIGVNNALKAKVKKTESVMEFFNKMFMENKMQNETVSDAKSANAAGTNSTSNASEEIFADWLTISSPSFKNKNRFPAISMPDGREVEIKMDKENFRINEGYNARNPEKDGPFTKRHFWFRLSGTHIYYAMSKTGLDVVGAIAITDLKDANSKQNGEQNQFCFKLDDEERQQWTLCSDTEDVRTKWVCKIKQNLNKQPIPSECEQAKEGNLLANAAIQKTVLEEKHIQPIILIPLPSRHCNEKWNYFNQGADWECMCSEGSEQSPIDLPTKEKAISSPVTPLFQYEEVQAKSPLTTIDGHVKTNQFIKIKYFDNALRILHPNLGKIVTLDGAVYVAEEIVFHTPSEHTIEGKRFDMEMQVIHYGQSKGDIAKQVVLSFLFKKKAGVYNKFIDDVDFFQLPNPLFTERDITNNLYVPKVFYSSTDEDIPVIKPFSFYTYQGSITFPPCTERTIHYVVADPIPIASAPLELFKEALRQPDMKDEDGNMIVNSDEISNFRTVQPLNDRPVFLFDHEKYCDQDVQVPQKKEDKPAGHYEKVPKKMTQYFYVSGSKPSGIPGAFVVDEAEGLGKDI